MLEVGCGGGRLTLEIAEHAESVFAFDPETLVPNGIILDLQVIRPDPRVEAVDGRLLCEADGTALFEYADAARDAVDLLIRERLLEEEAVDDHDVMQH